MEYTKVAKTVEKYVNEIRYGDEHGYVPSDFALEFINFIKLVNGDEGEEHNSPIVHYKMLDLIPGPRQNIANMCSRGLAKTTLLGEYLFLYIAVYGKIPGFGKVDFALYVSDSIENGVKNMRKNLEYRWENSDFLRKYVPKIKFTDVRWEFNNIEGNVFIIRGYGATTGVRGAKEMGKRPVLAVLDDLVSDTDAKSPTVIQTIEDTIYKAVDYALHPRRNKIIWSGTPFNAKDPLYKAVESGAWYVNVYPICEKFPCTREEFRGAWPDRFTYDDILSKYNKAMKAGKINTFNQELMLRIMSDDERAVKDEEIHWYSRTSLLRNKGNYNFYITTDFATSEETASDYSVISVWAYDHAGNWYWVDGICKKQQMNANIDDLFKLAQKYQPQGVGVEVSGQQGGFISIIQDQMIERNIYFVLSTQGNNNKPGIRPNTNKMQRFNVVQPWFTLAKIKFPKELEFDSRMIECMEELRLITYGAFKSKYDDFIDTITMLPLINAWKPSNATEMQYNDGNKMWEDIDDYSTGSRLSSYTV